MNGSQTFSNIQLNVWQHSGEWRSPKIRGFHRGHWVPLGSPGSRWGQWPLLDWPVESLETRGAMYGAGFGCFVGDVYPVLGG